MHSPEVLAFSIKRPWPYIKKPITKNNPKWALPIRRRADGSFYTTPFAYFNGKELYWPSIIDVWHMEPGGKDSLTVCKHRVYDEHGKFVKYSKLWKLHVWHWKITPVFIYGWRRRLFTRCAGCGGPSRKGKQVNHSNNGWGGGPKTPLYTSEHGLYHAECSAKLHKARHAHDPATCYNCTGSASIKKPEPTPAHANYLPKPRRNMPEAQRAALDSLNLAVNLNILPHAKALETYKNKLEASKWL